MKKTHFLSVALVFCIALIAIGVYAVNYLKLNISGTINFLTFDKLIYIQQIEVKNFVETTDGGQTYVKKSKVLDNYSGKYLSSSNNVSSVDLSNLSVLKGEDLTIEITLVSLFSDYDLCTKVTSSSVGSVIISAKSTILPANEGEKVSTGSSAMLIISISNETATSVNLSSLAINISFENLVDSLMKHSGSYYYIEMGTYDGNPVRWRYVADSNGEKYSNLSAPTTLKGYYVLDTKVSTRHAFLSMDKFSGFKHTTAGYTNINANDYALSDIRAYLTNTGDDGFMSSLGITTDNDVYSLIAARKITDLYINIRDNGTTIDSTNSAYALSLTGDYDVKNQEDKFWLLSETEVNTFLTDYTKNRWGIEYYTRSPNSAWDSGARIVDSYGDFLPNDFSANASCGVRAAFKI